MTVRRIHRPPLASARRDRARRTERAPDRLFCAVRFGLEHVAEHHVIDSCLARINRLVGTASVPVPAGTKGAFPPAVRAFKGEEVKRALTGATLLNLGFGIGLESAVRQFALTDQDFASAGRRQHSNR